MCRSRRQGSRDAGHPARALLSVGWRNPRRPNPGDSRHGAGEGPDSNVLAGFPVLARRAVLRCGLIVAMLCPSAATAGKTRFECDYCVFPMDGIVRTLALEDVTGDGRLEVIAGVCEPDSGGEIGSVRILRGHGNGGFAEVTRHRLPGCPEVMGIGGRGPGDKRQLLVIGSMARSAGREDSAFVCVLSVDAVGRIHPVSLSTLPTFAEEPRVGDYNGDGRLDIVRFPQWDERGLRILMQTCEGSFARGDSLPGVGRLIDADIADLNGDGIPDLVQLVAGDRQGALELWSGASARGCAPETLLAAPSLRAFRIGDIDRDGRQDVTCLWYRPQATQLWHFPRATNNQAFWCPSTPVLSTFTCLGAQGFRREDWPACAPLYGLFWVGRLGASDAIYACGGFSGDEAVNWLAGADLSNWGRIEALDEAHLGRGQTEPVVGDIDGDGRLDILAGTDEGIAIRSLPLKATGTLSDEVTDTLMVKGLLATEVDRTGRSRLVVLSGQANADSEGTAAISLWTPQGRGKMRLLQRAACDEREELLACPDPTLFGVTSSPVYWSSRAHHLRLYAFSDTGMKALAAYPDGHLVRQAGGASASTARLDRLDDRNKYSRIPELFPPPSVMKEFGTVRCSELRACDIDNDGDWDFAQMNGDLDTLDIFYGDEPDGPPVRIPVGERAEEACLGFGDLDGDGRKDVVVCSTAGTVRVFRQSAAHIFGFLTELLVPSGVTQLEVADLDGDRRAEIVMLTNAETEGCDPVPQAVAILHLSRGGRLEPELTCGFDVDVRTIAVGEIDGHWPRDLFLGTDRGVLAVRGIAPGGSRPKGP